MNMNLRFKKFWFTLWLLGLCLGVYLSLRPGGEIPLIMLSDKIIHACSYALLSIFAVCIFHSKRAVLGALFFLAMFSGMIELAQGYLTTTRSMEFADCIANCIGIVVGAYVASRWNILHLLECKLQFSRPRQ